MDSSIISEIIGSAVILMTFVWGYLSDRKHKIEQTRNLIEQTKNLKFQNEAIQKQSKEIENMKRSHEETFEKLLYKSNVELTANMKEEISIFLSSARKGSSGKPYIIKAKFLSIAMRYSLPNFIRPNFKAYLEKYPNVKIDIEILVAKKDLLDQYGFTEWSEESVSCTNEFEELAKALTKDYGTKRFYSALKVYNSIPQWHGWYLQFLSPNSESPLKEILYLGRTKIQEEEGTFKLTVGENEYRKFERLPTEEALSNLENIRFHLFLDWFNFYWKT